MPIFMRKNINCICRRKRPYAKNSWNGRKKRLSMPESRFPRQLDATDRQIDQLVYETLFFTAVQQNPGTPDARITIVK